MHNLLPFAAAGLFVVSGCASSTIGAHQLEAVVEYNGVTTRSVLAFPDRDPEASHAAGDSSCSFSKGNCGNDSPTDARVEGEGGSPTPIATGRYTTLHTGENGTYDIALTRTADDEAAYQRMVKEHGSAAPTLPTIMCRVYESQLGTPQKCFYSTLPVSITLTPR